MRKCLMVLLSLSVMMMSPLIMIGNAMEISPQKESYGCPLPRTITTKEDEMFVDFIENEYGISRNDENVFV